jgi:hypothetical protein
MRLLLGIVLGALLTVAGAYLYDSSHAPNANAGAVATTGSAAATERPLVNWDVVNEKWDYLTERARAEWNRLRASTRET